MENLKIEKNKDRDFYINEIKVLEWLTNDSYQKIRFTDRIEYKNNDDLHREDGPAIEFHNNIGNQYYINGKRLEMEEWKNYNRNKLIESMTN